MPRKPPRITCREEVCAAPLDQLTILSAIPDFSHDPANLYVVNPDESGDDVYIGELADERLRALVRIAPQLAGKLLETPQGDEDLDDLIEIANLLREALQP